MNQADRKTFYLDQLAGVRAKRDALPRDSHARRALTEDVLRKVEQKILETSPSGLDYGYWPPLYGFVAWM
jgi:hypothetical protein